MAFLTLSSHSFHKASCIDMANSMTAQQTPCILFLFLHRLHLPPPDSRLGDFLWNRNKTVLRIPFEPVLKFFYGRDQAPQTKPQFPSDTWPLCCQDPSEFLAIATSCMCEVSVWKLWTQHRMGPWEDACRLWRVQSKWKPTVSTDVFSASEPSLKGKCSEMLCSGRGFEFTNGWISLWETRLIVKCLWS